MVSEGHVGGSRGSGIMSGAADVLWMRGVAGLCDTGRRGWRGG